jgi:hypothetical protein
LILHLHPVGTGERAMANTGAGELATEPLVSFPNKSTFFHLVECAAAVVTDAREHMTEPLGALRL